MKRQRTTEIAKSVVLIITMIIIFCWCSWFEVHYTREATVTAVAGEEVTVVDTNGNEWMFIGNEFNVNDNVKLIMNTMHTELNIYDDVIEDVERR